MICFGRVGIVLWCVELFDDLVDMLWLICGVVVLIVFVLC